MLGNVESVAADIEAKVVTVVCAIDPTALLAACDAAGYTASLMSRASDRSSEAEDDAAA